MVDPHGCPYASPSAFAREPLLLGLDDLVDDGFLVRAELPEPRPVAPVDWPGLQRERTPLLRVVGERITERVDLAAFVKDNPWVRTWAAFQVLTDLHGPFWPDWPTEVRDLPLDPARLAKRLGEPHLLTHIALQWAVERQWRRVRQLARAFDVELWGDLPFFVGLDSADVWAHRELFEVEPDGRPRFVTGVPPDAFSADGQLWGHPQLTMEAHAAQGWSWWVERAEAALSTVDVLRIDHFRGLESVWSVPAGAETAAAGRWLPGPGSDPLQRLVSEGARLVAEDLGIITPEVRALRDQAGLPGMAVLQFAFGPAGEPHFLPHAHQPEQVVYTGTHDNDTLAGFLQAAGPHTLGHLEAYLGQRTPSAVRRAAWRSVARAAILPLQDLLGLGSDARTNVPGTLDANWSWRCSAGHLDDTLATDLAREAILSARTGASS